MLFGAIKSFLAIAIVLHLAFRLEILQSLKAHCSYNSTFYSTMDKIASAIISSKLITTAPKNAQEVKQEIQNLKDDAIQKLQEGSQKLVDKAKQTIEEVDKDPAQPKSQEGQ